MKIHYLPTTFDGLDYFTNCQQFGGVKQSVIYPLTTMEPEVPKKPTNVNYGSTPEGIFPGFYHSCSPQAFFVLCQLNFTLYLLCMSVFSDQISWPFSHKDVIHAILTLTLLQN